MALNLQSLLARNGFEQDLEPTLQHVLHNLLKSNGFCVKMFFLPQDLDALGKQDGSLTKTPEGKQARCSMF